MMTGKRIYTFLVTLVVGLLMLDCSHKSPAIRDSNEFIQNFLDKNSIRIYKSEIQRVKVNFFPISNALVYSFWKREKFDANGELFLHLYPKDNDDLLENRKAHGFVNLPIDKKKIVQTAHPYFYAFQNLQLPYDIFSIKTGQYNDSVKTWKSSFDDHKVLEKRSLKKKEMLSAKNYTHLITDIDGSVSFLQHFRFGPIVYESQDSGLTIFFDANLNRFVYLFRDYKEKVFHGTKLYVDIFSGEAQRTKRMVISWDQLEIYGRDAVLPYDLGIDEYFDTLKLGEIENGKEKTWKVLDKKELIYTTFPFIPNPNDGLPSMDDATIALIHNLISKNLPLIFYSATEGIELYLNKFAKKAYLVSFNADDFDGLKLECTVEGGRHLITQAMNLQNSSFIKGKKGIHIVVCEIDLSEVHKLANLQINADGQTLFKQNLEF